MYAIAALTCVGAGVGTVWKAMRVLSGLLKKAGISYGPFWIALPLVGGAAWLNWRGLLPEGFREPEHLLVAVLFCLGIAGLAGIAVYTARFILFFLFKRSFSKQDKRVQANRSTGAATGTTAPKNTAKKHGGLLKRFLHWYTVTLGAL